ncbi:MAG: PilZ domain-containing protein [Desulfurivibrionaceae bacterium]|nr:PilZ domain-containing protein [Desulfurivibrionaceae bacterium]
MDEEARIMKRRQLFYYLKLYDQTTGEQVGNVVDITTQGCKIISKDPLPTGQTMALRLDLPEGLSSLKNIVLQGKTLWSRPDVNPDFYVTGFEVPELGTKERQVLGRLIDQTAFND